MKIKDRSTSANQAIVAMIMSAACWGGGTTLSRHTLSRWEPLPLLVIQLSASVAFLYILMLLRQQRPDLSATSLRRNIIGVLEPGLAYIFAMLGLKRIDASLASLIAASEPVMVMAILYLAGRDLPSRGARSCALIALCGVGMIVAESSPIPGGETFTGALLVTAATFCAAVYVTISRDSVAHQPPIQAAMLQQASGLLLIVTVFLLFAPLTSIVPAGPRDLALAIASGIVQYGLAFWLYLFAIRSITISSAALMLNLIPVFGVLTAHIFLGEIMNGVQYTGSAVVIAALVWLSTIKSHEGECVSESERAMTSTGFSLSTQRTRPKLAVP
jgi:drug/metabolite transporter (DMT)-like permease